jgi:hypothetical protein
MTPFAVEFSDTEHIEEIFEFAIDAWNIANLNIISPNDDIEKTMNSISHKAGGISLLKKMIAHKQEKYKEFTKFMVGFELKEIEAGKGPVLRVVAQEEEAYIAEMMNEMEEDTLYGQADFGENFINRKAVILKPKQPFLDWYSALNLEDGFEEEMTETKTYLIDDSIGDPEKWLKKKFDTFFRMELDEWHGNKKEWPQKRTYKMFNLWFRVELSGMIYDLEKNPVLKYE